MRECELVGALIWDDDEVTCFHGFGINVISPEVSRSAEGSINEHFFFLCIRVGEIYYWHIEVLAELPARSVDSYIRNDDLVLHVHDGSDNVGGVVDEYTAWLGVVDTVNEFFEMFFYGLADFFGHFFLGLGSGDEVFVFE